MSWAVKHPLTTLETLAWLKWKQRWPYQVLLVPGTPGTPLPGGEGWKWGCSFILDSLGAFPTSLIAWVEQYHCWWSFGNSNNYWPGLWPARKLTDDRSKSSHNPIKSGPDWGPLSSPGCQWVEPAPLRGTFLELVSSHVCDICRTVAESWRWGLCWYPQPLEAQPLPFKRCQGIWHISLTQREFLTSTFVHIDMYI